MYRDKINVSPKILLGHSAFLVLFFLAIYYYLERTIFVDPACSAFKILYYQNFASEASRYVAVIPQGLPLLAIWLHLPLKVVLCLYSMSFILLYYIIFLVITYWFRNENLALAIPLVLLMGVQYSFFWISTETHQALVYNILLVAFLYYSQKMNPGFLNNLIKLIIAAGILFLCFYSHPVSLFPILFILGYFMIDQKLWKKTFVYILVVFIIAITITKVFIVPTNQYDTANFNSFLSFFEKIGQVQTSESLAFLTEKIFTLYFFSLIIFIVTSVFYIIKKQYLKLSYYLASIILFLLVIFTTFPLWYYPFIQEKNLMPLNIFLLVPFMNEVAFSDKRLNIFKQIFLILIFVVGVVNVINASSFYKERLAYIRSLIYKSKKFPEKKIIIKKWDIDLNKVNVTWALPMESLLLSSLEDPNLSRSIYVDEPDKSLKQSLNLNDSLLFICASWWTIDLREKRMDKQYFNLDNSPYRFLSANEMYSKNKKIIYINNFDDLSSESKGKNNQDSSANSFYLLTTEYSPGFCSKYSDLSNKKSILLSATVKVCPLEEVNPRSLNLIISRERGPIVFDYYMSYLYQPYVLNPQNWITISVSGIVRNENKDEILKIYLWNPGKKKIRVDDFVVFYTTD